MLRDEIMTDDVEAQGIQRFNEIVNKAIDEALPIAKAEREREQAEQEQRQQAEAAQQEADAKKAAYTDYLKTAASWGLPTDTQSAKAYSQNHFRNYIPKEM